MSSDQAVTDEVSKVLDTLNSVITSFTVQNLPDILVQIMTVVSSSKALSTDQQKAVVIAVVQSYMTKYSLTDSEQTIVMSILPSLIDKMIALDNGTITISSIEQVASTDCSSFFLWLKSLGCAGCR